MKIKCFVVLKIKHLEAFLLLTLIDFIINEQETLRSKIQIFVS